MGLGVVWIRKIFASRRALGPPEQAGVSSYFFLPRSRPLFCVQSATARPGNKLPMTWGSFGRLENCYKVTASCLVSPAGTYDGDRRRFATSASPTLECVPFNATARLRAAGWVGGGRGGGGTDNPMLVVRRCPGRPNSRKKYQVNSRTWLDENRRKANCRDHRGLLE